MDQKRLVKISKFLSRHLRHSPERLGLTLERGGWVPVDDLLRGAAEHGQPVTRAELEAVVAGNDKQRFGFDPTGRLIRAHQGHSIPVELDLEAAEPPVLLFHGTSRSTLPTILRDGLLPMRRHLVHLSPDRDTAERVGRRHGPPVVLRVDAAGMRVAGTTFWLSTNGVWLVTAVPPTFLTLEPDR